jgi:pilus assembly protein CpaC
MQWTKDSGDFGSDVTSASGKLTFSDFLNLFVLSEKYDLGILIRALQSRGLFQSLAEPNLVAESGKEASFLAGGEFPIPVAQGSGANIGVSVMFKEYGVRLGFTPVINGDRIHLKVRPEVSTLDFANAVQLAGFRIPALTSRRTETEIELRDRQTFAIAGLLNNNMTSTMQKIPGIGDIPVLGLLFRSKAAQKNRTELVVMITPEILRAGSVGVTGTLPRQEEPYLPGLQQNRSIAPPRRHSPPARELGPVSKTRSMPIAGEEAMLKRFRNLWVDERGVSFAFVGIGLMTFMAATTLPWTSACSWTARTQAQTSATPARWLVRRRSSSTTGTIAVHPDPPFRVR